MPFAHSKGLVDFSLLGEKGGGRKRKLLTLATPQKKRNDKSNTHYTRARAVTHARARACADRERQTEERKGERKKGRKETHEDEFASGRLLSRFADKRFLCKRKIRNECLSLSQAGSVSVDH